MKIEEVSNLPQPSLNNNSPQGNTSSIANYDLSYFVNLDSENKICFDCGGPMPTYVSINNGVFICFQCAINHSKLGYNISYIHTVSSPWDQYLLSYAIRGGNSRFKRLCNQYQVPCESSKQDDEEKLNKYIIRLGEFHRLTLRSEIMADEPPPPLYLEVAKNKCDLNIIYFPEFQNYQLYKGDIIIKEKKNNIGGKIWNGTKATAGLVGSAGGMVYKVGKPVVCFLGKTAYSGLKYLGKSIYNHYYPEDEKNKLNINGEKVMNNGEHNSFALVDYTDEDLKEIKTINLDNYNDNGNVNNINNNITNGNYNNYSHSVNNNKYNTYISNGNGGNINIINNNVINNENFNHNNYEYINNHNNIIANDNYLINNEQDNYNLYNKKSYNDSSLKNMSNFNNDNNNYSMDGFEIIANNNQEKDFIGSSNSLFDNNLYSGMNVEFENTDQQKARQDANNFLLKP